MRNRAGVPSRDENDFINAGTACIDKSIKKTIELPESVKASKAKPVSISLAEKNLLSIDLHIKNEIMNGNFRANRSDVVRAAILSLDTLTQKEVSELIERAKMK